MAERATATLQVLLAVERFVAVEQGDFLGVRVMGEKTAAEKVALLKGYFDRNETLDGPQGRQNLDVRTLSHSP